MSKRSDTPSLPTPGPWKVGEDEPFVYALNAHGSNRFFTSVQPGWLAGEAVEGRTTNDELLANARLIAAAPDLLEALQALSAMYAHTWDRVDGALVMMDKSVAKFEDAHEMATKAIEKARGK